MKTLVSEILDQKRKVVYTINENERVYNAVEKFHKYRIGSLLVVNNEENLVGIITERDILYKCYQSNEALTKSNVKVKERMTSSENLFVGKIDDTATSIMNIMVSKNIRHIPILDGETIVGIISVGDALKGALDARELEAKMLREHIKNPFGVHIYK
ncbi:MAG: CBS domain-containing protein [Clostridiales bacterium]|nr:CBS domain-containing protein [Clostridiales bacterium]